MSHLMADHVDGMPMHLSGKIASRSLDPWAQRLICRVGQSEAALAADAPPG
jgi:hypothetical protein